MSDTIFIEILKILESYEIDGEKCVKHPTPLARELTKKIETYRVFYTDSLPKVEIMNDSKSIIKKLWYENPMTGTTSYRELGMILQEDKTGKKYNVIDIRVEINHNFAEIEYSNGTIERTYKIHNILYKPNN